MKNKKYLIELDEKGNVIKLTTPPSLSKQATLREGQIIDRFSRTVSLKNNEISRLSLDIHILQLQEKNNFIIQEMMKELIVYAMQNSKEELALEILSKKESIKRLMKRFDDEIEKAKQIPVVDFEEIDDTEIIITEDYEDDDLEDEF